MLQFFFHKPHILVETYSVLTMNLLVKTFENMHDETHLNASNKCINLQEAIIDIDLM